VSGIGFVLRPANVFCAKAKRQQQQQQQQQQHEGRHDVGHFGNAIGRGDFTDAGRLAVIA